MEWPNIPIHSLYSPVNTLAAFMALSLDGAFTDPSNQFVYALVELAVVLLMVTMVVNIVARLLVKQGFIRSAEGAGESMSSIEKNSPLIESVTVQTTVPWYERKVSAADRQRQIVDKIIKGLIVGAVFVVLIPLIDMLYMFAYKGLSVISISDLTQTTTGGTGLGGGGILNAIVGSLVILALSAVIAVPVGVFSGVYLAEFAGETQPLRRCCSIHFRWY